MEKDNELKGNGNSYDFGARIYDPRLGRWMTLDPEARLYPDLSDYSFVANSPLMFIDPTGKIIKLASNLNSQEKERLQAALKLVEKKTPELYNYLNQLRYHAGNKTFVSPGDEGYDEAFDVVIEIGIENLDGVERDKERRNNPSSTTIVLSDPEKHQEGESRTAEGTSYAGVKKNEDGTYSVVDMDERKWVVITNPEQMEKGNFSLRWRLEEGKVHFEILLDNYVGNEYDDGKYTTHEMGHIEDWISNVLNAFYFGNIYEGESKGGHETGNTSGENANKRESEYEEAE